MGVIGVLHPGAMGTAAAVTAKNSGHVVYWASSGRSEASRRRAEAAGLTDAGSLAEMCGLCPAILSVCPPEFAESLCEEALRLGFRGLYIDANAVAPQRKVAIAGQVEAAGGRFVDGGIIGTPPKQSGETWLILSGRAAGEAAQYFTAGPIEPEAIGEEIGKASALKMCFAAYAKGANALMAATFAAAGHYGVAGELKKNWERRGRSFASIERDLLRAAPKAWRFVPEMHEIAATLDAAGLPTGFHLAAAEVYERLAGFKDRPEAGVEEVLDFLTADLRPAGASH